MRLAVAATILWAFCAPGAQGQPVAAPAFEVASIKIARHSATMAVCIVPCGGERVTVDGTRVDIRSISLYQLIVMAYRVKLNQVSGPNWISSQKFDIAAKMPEGASTDRLPEMLRSLLAERFRLSARRERKEQPVYALVLKKSGPQPKAALADADAPFTEAPGGRTMQTAYGQARMDKSGAWRISEGPYSPARLTVEQLASTQVEFLKITMPRLAEALTASLDRVVTDSTGLSGNYQVRMDWAVPPPPRTAAAADLPLPAPPPSLSFQSLEKAGLRLEASRSPVEVIVVDSLQKMPTSN